MKRIAKILLLAVLTMTGHVHAGPGNAAPLGLELGAATLADVQKEVGTKFQLSDLGINKFSGGKMLSGTGNGLGIDGLSEIAFIFDQNNVLAGVLMTLPKKDNRNDLQNGNFKKTAKALASKYKKVEMQDPFVGSAYARFSQGKSVIELDAPHMSFTMSLRYVTSDFMSNFNKQAAADRASKDQAQAGKL